MYHGFLDFNKESLMYYFVLYFDKLKKRSGLHRV